MATIIFVDNTKCEKITYERIKTIFVLSGAQTPLLGVTKKWIFVGQDWIMRNGINISGKVRIR
jgi:hypothetical protein